MTKQLDIEVVVLASLEEEHNILADYYERMEQADDYWYSRAESRDLRRRIDTINFKIAKVRKQLQQAGVK